MDHPIQCIVETALYVPDLDQAEAFYSGLLELPVIGREAGRHVFFRAGPADVLLVFFAPATLQGDVLPAHGAQGAGHLALGIPAAGYDAWKARLEAHGVVIEKEIHWPRGGRSMYFRDPAGNSAELLTPGLWGLPAGW